MSAAKPPQSQPSSAAPVRTHRRKMPARPRNCTVSNAPGFAQTASHVAAQAAAIAHPTFTAGPSRVRAAPTRSSNGAPACQSHSSAASTRCQWLRSPSRNRNRIAVPAPRVPSAGASRQVSRYVRPPDVAEFQRLDHRLRRRRGVPQIDQPGSFGTVSAIPGFCANASYQAASFGCPAAMAARQSGNPDSPARSRS